MAHRGRLAGLGELVAVWVGSGLAIAATLLVVGGASGRRVVSDACNPLGLGQDWLAIQFVALVAVVGATTMALLYWALGAETTRVRLGRIILALGVGVVVFSVVVLLVDGNHNTLCYPGPPA